MAPVSHNLTGVVKIKGDMDVIEKLTTSSQF